MRLIEEIGAYSGLAAVLGLAVLSALYFSHARDLKRLREWAGRAPERSPMYGAPQVSRVTAQPNPRAMASRPTGPPPPQATPPGAGAAPAGPVPASAGAVPAASGVLAAATPVGRQSATAAAGSATEAPDAPGNTGAPAPVGQSADGAPEEPAATSGPPPPQPGASASREAEAASGSREEEEAPSAQPSGSAPTASRASPPMEERAAEASPPPPAGTGKAGASPAERPPERPSPSTAAGAAPPLPSPSPAPSPPPRIPSPPAARPAGAPILPPYETMQQPPPRRSYRRLLSKPLYGALAVLGILIVGLGAALGLSQLAKNEAPPRHEQASPASGGGDAAPPATGKAPLNPARVTVSVLNGTTVPGLARQLGDKIEARGFRLGNVDNSTDQQRAESAVLYAPGHAREAAAVGRGLHISQREPIDPQSQALGGDATVIVVAGQDKTP